MLPVHISILKISIWNEQLVILVQKYEWHWYATWYTPSLCSNTRAINHLYPQIPKLNEAAESEFNLQTNGIRQFCWWLNYNLHLLSWSQIILYFIRPEKKTKTKGGKTLNKQVTEYLQIFSVDLFSHVKMYS